MNKKDERQEPAAGVTRRGFLAGSSAGIAAGWAGGAMADPAAEKEAAAPPQGKELARITLVQLTLAGEKANTVLERMGPFFEEAAAYGSDLIVFPEYVLGNRIDMSHKNVQGFFALARQHNIYAVAGCVENHGDQWATTALVVDRQGVLLGRYLKCHPAAGSGEFCWPPLADNNAEARGILGHQFKVFRLDFGAIGILQCYDGYFPEAWGCTSYSGAEIILWINGRTDFVEDAHCVFNAQAFGCVVGGTITDGWNTGFAAPRWSNCLHAEGTPKDEMHLFPSLPERGDGCVHATIDMYALRRHRKHLRYMHQRRPELYGLLTHDVKMWQDYPDIPWKCPECADLVNKAQL